jgi:pyruvate,water dikinase
MTTALKAVKWLSELSPSDRTFTGSKATNLGRLSRGGWLTPGGFCITTSAYQQFITHNDLAHILNVSTMIGHRRENITQICLAAQSSVESAVIPDDVVASIAVALKNLPLLHDSDGTLAVRSSATVEDQMNGSFAGLFQTFLNTSADQVLSRVKSCWASLWNVASVTWLTRSGGSNRSLPDYSMAVIVQPMIRASRAGVMFTANPISGNPFEIVINSGWGSADAIVSGNTDCDTFVINESDLSVARKHTRHKLRNSAPAATISGCAGKTADDNDKCSPSLNNSEVIRLVNLGLELQREFGSAQDVEWAMIDDRIYLLQSRPIVKLPLYFPLTQGLQRPTISKWSLEFPDLFSHFGRSLERLKDPVYNAARSKVFCVKFLKSQKIINGYIYHHTVQKAPLLIPSVLLKMWRCLRWAVQARHADRQFKEEILPSFQKKAAVVRSSLAICESPHDLIGALNAAVDCYLFLQANTVLVNNLAIFFCGLVMRLSKPLGGIADPLQAAMLFSGLTTKTSERDARLAELIQFFHVNQLSDVVNAASSWNEAAAALKQTTSGANFLCEFERFEREFGYVWADKSVKDPGWHREDGLILAVFRNGSRSATSSCCQNDGTDNLALPAPSFSIRQILFYRLLQIARRYHPCREDHNHYLSEAVVLIREALLSCGACAVQLAKMDKPEDIFHLTYEEVAKLPQILSSETSADLRRLIRTRALEAMQQRRLTPPTFIDLEQGNNSAPPPPSPSMQLFGNPGSPGVVSGPARVVRRGNLQDVRDGDILVCHNFRPDWSPLFRHIRGLVTNRGYSLTHGANLAREWGIPAVMGAAEATQMIRDGDIISIDGNTGSVQVHSLS